MSKDKKYFLEVNALAFLLTAYCYYKMNKDEEHNSFYNYPIKTSVNWTPMALASFMLLLTSTTSLILSLNPGRSNFQISKFQKLLDNIASSAPGVLALATEAGFKLAKIVGGVGAETAQELTTDAISLAEQALRFVLTLEQIHAHEMARSIEISGSQDESIQNGLYLTRSGYIAHQVDKALILTVESAVQYAWRSGVYKFLTHYLSISDKDTLKALATLYLVADITKWIGTNSINNIALAAEIVIYGEDKTPYYKIEDPTFINAIRDFTNAIEEEIRKAKEEFQELKTKLAAKAKEVEDKLAEVMHLKQISEAAEEARAEISRELYSAKAEFIALSEQLTKKTQEFEAKVAEALHFKELFESGLKAKEQLSRELESFNHFCGKQFQELQNAATKIQSSWKGMKTRNDPTIKGFISKMKDSTEAKVEAKVIDHAEVQDRSITPSATNSLLTSPAAIEADHKADKKEQTKPAEHHRHSIFGNLFHHDDDNKGEKPDHHEGFLSHLFNPHHQAAADPKTDTDKNDQNKVSDSSSKSKTQQTQSPAKTDKANLNEKSNETYITLVIQKMAELILILFASKSKLKAPKNKEQEEYEQAKKEMEENANKTVLVKYESFAFIEIPETKNKTVFQKADNELLDSMIGLKIMPGVSAEFIGEEGGFYHFNGAAFAI